MLTTDERNILAKKITSTAVYYGKFDLTKEQTTFYINILEENFNKTTMEYIRAIDLYISDFKNKFFPSVAALRQYVLPEQSDDQLAVDVASRVFQAVSDIGYSNQTAARAFIGDLGWLAVNKYGGWIYICENLGKEIQITSFQAQIREISKSIIYKAKMGIEDGPIQIAHRDPDIFLNDKKRNEILRLSDNLKSLKNIKK